MTKIPTSPSRLRALASRAGENFRLDWHFLHSPYLSRSARSRFVLEKYRAIAGGRTSIPWFGRELFYDNRFTPALLQAYPGEIEGVIRATGLRGEVSVLDVGANIGQFGSTVRGALPLSRVWSFEPNPEALGLLRRNADEDDRWTVLGYGVSAEDATLDFYFVPGKSAQGSVHAGNATLGLLGGEPRHVQVPVQKLTPERLADAGAPTRFDFVKVDVEGAERQAIRGLAVIEWEYLLIELSAERGGTMTLDELLAECKAIWGHEMQVAVVLAVHDFAQELILRNPAFRAA